MTFLNPFVLFGLAAAAIPILIHLLNRRKLRTIDFSTLTFLKELQRNKIRRIKIRQWLLLALRTLLIALIVFAFSRPALKGSIGIVGSHAKTTIAIIIDNSFSMSLHNEQGKYLSQAQSKANELLALMEEGDDALILRLSDLPNATTEQSTHNIQHLRTIIQETEVSYKHSSIDEALRLTSRLLQQSKNFNKEIYIITDGQKSSFISPTSQSQQEEHLFDANTKIFFTQLTDKIFENIGIEQVTISPSIIQLNKPFPIKVFVKNHGTNSVHNHLVGINTKGKRNAQKSITLKAGESATVDFMITPNSTGFFSFSVELEDDELLADNVWYVSLFVPEQIRVALITPDVKHAKYIKTALTVFQQSGTMLSLNQITSIQLSNSIVENSDVLIFSGVKELSVNQHDNVNKFLNNGGGAIYFPSSDSSINYSTIFSNNLLAETKLIRSLNVQSGFTFDKTDREFPVFRGMFEEDNKSENKSLESPTVFTVLQIQKTDRVRTIISLSNGIPFLWNSDIGSGKLIGFSVPATTEWSDFPLRGIFLPLVYQSVLYLASGENSVNAKQNIFVGDKVEFTNSSFQPKNNRFASTIQFFDPNNRESKLQSFKKNNSQSGMSSIFSFTTATIPGIYIAKSKTDTLLEFPLNMHRSESMSERIVPNEFRFEMKNLGIAEKAISFISPQENIGTAVLQSRFGIELWRYFLLLAVVIALIEMIIAREPKKLHDDRLRTQ